VSAAQKPPAGLGTSGRKLWRAVTGTYELQAHELALLRQAAATLDLLDQLAAVVEAEGVTSTSSQGDRVHPAVVELRHQRIALGRLLAALGIPADEAADEPGAASRPRPGSSAFRGVYAIGGGAS
jgi:hypothetical protein